MSATPGLGFRSPACRATTDTTVNAAGDIGASTRTRWRNGLGRSSYGPVFDSPEQPANVARFTFLAARPVPQRP